jgi:hypothetical protein
MPMQPAVDPIESFIARWQASGAAVRANYQLFLAELCDVIGVERPEPGSADPTRDRYRFEHPVTFPHLDGSTSSGRIDLYKRGCFVLEAKQGADQELQEQLPLFGGEGRSRRGTAVRGTRHWDVAMQRARGQSERYAKALPTDHGWPPFLVVVDVGHCTELYADFSLTGKSYSQFPDARGFRINLEQLRDPEIRNRLRRIWTEPMSLDPSRHAAEVTRAVSERLAVVARALEKDGHPPELVAAFLMRCLFSMFAEDIGLLPAGCFTRLLETMRGREPKQLVHALGTLWSDMNRGTPFSGIAGHPLLQFNGGLFREHTALPLAPEHLGLLIEAAKADWRHVEPAIFGTFLEQALNARERRKLGAEFTPRRWVERLVMPAVIEPLREQWNSVKATALAYGMAGRREEAVRAVKDFHRHLCHLRILDPACGSGNFLYVTMEHMKRLEGEVIDLMQGELGEPESTLELERFTVDPHQFLGIEINPRAATIAEVVLWIGYLQWHFRTRGRVMPAQPVLKNFRNIEGRDAILAYDREELVRGADGRPVTRWDGHSMKTDLATGREVPDETGRIEIRRYVNPCPAKWPAADYIIGNPPFTGGKDLRERLGNYAEALWQAYPDMPRSADLVMYWWRRAADLVRTGKAQRFGLITTNSIWMTYNRRVVLAQLDAKPPLGLVFAIPDHPWYLGGGMAAVRIAMTVGAVGRQEGQLIRAVDPNRSATQGGDDLQSPAQGLILSNLTIGADLDAARPLRAHMGLCGQGIKLHGSGFIVSPDTAKTLGLGFDPAISQHIKPFRNGRDITRRPRNVMVIDLFDLNEQEVSTTFPMIYQYILQHVKPERDHNNRKSYREQWWIFGEPRAEIRPILKDLGRYIATVRVAKHRIFTFLDEKILPESRLIVIGLNDAFALGILSSLPHLAWALATGGRHGVGNDPVYYVTSCFDPFPFPDATEAQKQTIRQLAEELDGHRKRVLEAHGDLTLTGLYNVLEKLRTGQALSAKDRDVHERGLVSVLRHLHDRIDAAVLDAYGWSRDLSEQDILARLVALNRERREEEARGHVRWLRPEYQAPAARRIPVSEQGRLDIRDAPIAARRARWPRTLPERVTSMRRALAEQKGPARVEDLARRFERARRGDVQEILEALVAMGLARQVGGERYAP